MPIKITKARIRTIDGVIGKFITKLRQTPDYADKFINYIKEKAKQMDRFIEPGKSPVQRVRNQLVVLRKWNSFTPLLPHEQDRPNNKGGGYFIRIDKTGLVIDPGFNFCENFLRAKFKLDDIDHIFISHAHNDHCVELEGIFSLLFKRNKKFPKNPKKIKLYMNLGAFKKFSGYFDLSKPPDNYYLDDIILLNKHQHVRIDSTIELLTTQVKHHEMISANYALGYTFIFNLPEKKRIVKFMCDGGWDQKIEEKNKKWAEDHMVNKVDVLIPHIGTIKKRELKYNIRKRLNSSVNKSKLYESHLGLIGTVAVIHYWQPDIVLLSEFGEELDAIRKPISDLLTDQLMVRVFSTDLNFRMDLDNLNLMCFKTKRFYPADEIKIEYYRSQLYPIREASLSGAEKTDLDAVLAKCKIFE